MLFKKTDLQSDITSKASLFMGPAKLQREHNEAQQEATEATELQGTSQWLQVPVVVASSSLSHGPHQRRICSFIAAFKKFWRLQVIATVPENECQNHFGTDTPYSSLSIVIYISCAFSSRSGSNAPIIIVKAFHELLSMLVLSPVHGGLCTLTKDDNP